MAGTKPSGEPGWKWRRWLIFPSVVFFAYELDMIRQSASLELLRLMAYSHVIAFVVLVSFYAGFATIQDVIAIIKTGRGLPYKEDPPTATEVTFKETHGEQPKGGL